MSALIVGTIGLSIEQQDYADAHLGVDAFDDADRVDLVPKTARLSTLISRSPGVVISLTRAEAKELAGMLLVACSRRKRNAMAKRLLKIGA